MRTVGARRFPVGPSIAARSAASSGGDFLRSKVITLFPLATITRDALRARRSASSAPSLLRLAETSSLKSMPRVARNPCERAELVHPFRRYPQSTCFFIGSLLPMTWPGAEALRRIRSEQPHLHRKLLPGDLHPHQGPSPLQLILEPLQVGAVPLLAAAHSLRGHTVQQPERAAASRPRG